MNYRAAIKSDAEQIAHLHADSWRRTYRGMLRDDFLDGEVVRNRLEVWNGRLGSVRTDQFVLVAENQKQVVGFICVYGNEDPRYGSLIDNLHVAHAHKREGIGTFLMRQAGDWLHQNYARYGVYLWVMGANQPARRFYEELGSTNAGTIDKPNPAGGGSAPNCRYIWPTPEALANAG